jgi:hypothetical protein
MTSSLHELFDSLQEDQSRKSHLSKQDEFEANEVSA